MKNKKGFEIQFNWIFVLVAGALILLFFITIVVKQRNLSETSTKSTIFASVGAIIAGAGVSTGTTTIIDLPGSNIEVDCGRVSIGEIAKQYQNLILFAPKSIQGKKLITQTVEFNTPYKSTNLLFMTSTQMRYILIGDSDLAIEINNSLPSDLNKEFYKNIPVTISDENNYKVKFVFFRNIDNSILNKFAKMQDDDVTAVRVTGDIKKGELEFYKKNSLIWKSNGISPYFTKSALLGAIYSDSNDLYQCNMANVFSRLNIISNVYLKRTTALKNDVTRIRNECKSIYTNALNHLQSINSASSVLNEPNVEVIASASQSLSDENKKAQLASCPLIY